MTRHAYAAAGRWVGFLLLPLVLASLACPADESQTSPAPKAPDEFRLVISNATAQALAGARVIRFEFQWPLLPEGRMVKEQRRADPARYLREQSNVRCGITIPNQVFRDISARQSWLYTLSKEQYSFLLSALSCRPLSPGSADTGPRTWNQISTALEQGQKYWDKPPLEKITEGPLDTVSVLKFLTARRDWYMVQQLFASSGAGYIMECSVREGSSPPTPISAQTFCTDNIDWAFDIYNIPEKTRTYYRYVISALAKAVQKQVEAPTTASADSAVNVSITVGLLDSQGMFIKETMADAEMDQDMATWLASKPAPATYTKSSLNIALSAILGISPEDAAAGLISGPQSQADLVAGGLVGGKAVSSVYGANYKEAGKNTGYMLGIAESGSLFLGPTYQTGILTIGAGPYFHNKDSGDETKVSFAGMLSFDVSRVLESKKHRATLALPIKTEGARFYTDSDTLYQPVGYVGLTLCATGDLKPADTKVVTLIQQTDENEVSLPQGTAPARITFTLNDFSGKEHYRYIRRGKYDAQFEPGFEHKDGANFQPKGLDFLSENVFAFGMTIRKRAEPPLKLALSDLPYPGLSKLPKDTPVVTLVSKKDKQATHTITLGDFLAGKTAWPDYADGEYQVTVNPIFTVTAGETRGDDLYKNETVTLSAADPPPLTWTIDAVRARVRWTRFSKEEDLAAIPNNRPIVRLILLKDAYGDSTAELVISLRSGDFDAGTNRSKLEILPAGQYRVNVLRGYEIASYDPAGRPAILTDAFRLVLSTGSETELVWRLRRKMR